MHARKILLSPTPLVAFHSSSEYDHSTAAAVDTSLTGHPFGLTIADSPLTATAFPAVFSPSAYSQKWPATHPTDNHPAGLDSPSVFLALLRPYSAHLFPVLFHTGPAHGVSSSRADFHSQSFLFSQTFIPSCGWLLSWLLFQ